MKNNKKTVIITAGAKGIGKSITNLFIKNRFNVVVVSRNASKIFKSNRNLLSLNLDLTKENSYETLINSTIDKFKSLDVLINNFGISEWKSIEKIDKEFLDKMFLSNFYSTLWGCKYSKKYLKKGSSIINISSIAGKRGSANNSVYSATKFAVNGLKIADQRVPKQKKILNLSDKLTVYLTRIRNFAKLLRSFKEN